MSMVIEKTYGRARLIECICDQRELLQTYNQAAIEYNRTTRERLAHWSPAIIEAMRRANNQQYRLGPASAFDSQRPSLSYKMKRHRKNIVHKFGHGCIAILIVGCAFTVACTQQTKPIGPKFSGRLLFLAGENTNGTDLFELSATSNGSGFNHSLVTTGVFEAAPNPDQTQLLYTTKDEILLRDLRNGAIKSVVKGENFCLAWSPDGVHFSYRQKSPADERAPLGESGARTKLYVSDLDGKSKLIWQDLTATYAASSPGQSAALERVAAASGCPQWIARDRLLFDRFLGASPNQRVDVLKPNSTTIATLSDRVT